MSELDNSWVVCVDNDGFDVSLDLGTIYRRLPDPKAEEHRMIRVIDESGEDYLYPGTSFVSIQLPETISRVVRERDSLLTERYVVEQETSEVRQNLTEYDPEPEATASAPEGRHLEQTTSAAEPALPDVDAINRELEREAPAVYRSLSPLGRRLFYPAGIPHQAAEARGKTYNGTIGQITDGDGGALPLPSLASCLALDGRERDRAFLYSPVDGLPELRRAWREHQRRGVADDVPSTLPLVTVGLTHALSIAADLFTGEGRPVAIPGPIWGNYRQTFALRRDAEMRLAPAFRDGRYNPRAVAEALAGAEPGAPALAILNAPSNPYGYMPTAAERAAVVASLLELAEERPLVVLCDDAYAGLVYEDVPTGSLFWELAGRHPNLLAVKIDGVTKELSFFGARVGFVTFGAVPESAVERALTSKVKSLVRSTVGSPVATTQMMVLRALQSPSIGDEVEAIRRRMAARYRVLQTALAELDPELLRPWPMNAGLFALLELPAGVDPERLRRHLLDRHDTGLVSVQPNFIRIAFCSVRRDALPELVRRLEQGVRELI